MSVSKDLVDIIKGSENKGTKAYDTPATVTRVDGTTVWVHIPGGVDETPVKRTINAKAGDEVQVRVSGGSAWLNGNTSAPPTDDTQANIAVEYALVAGNAADSAVRSAKEASDAAADAKATADSVHGIATQALADATVAKDAADNASEYAARALGNLSTVQSVTETLNWITQHGTMALTTDVALDPTHVYFVQDAGGDYVVGGVTYAIVTEPDVDDIGTYYELTIDESLNNYVGTHLALTSEGLWVLPSGMASGTTPAPGEAQDDSDARQASNYKALLSSSGLKIYDGSGNLVSTFGQSVIFADDRQQVIGGQYNYILFDPDDGSITISGSNVKIGNTGKVLSDVLTDIDVSVEQTAGGADITVNGDTVHISDGAAGDTGPEGVVTVYLSAVDWSQNTGTLAVTLRVDGTITTPSTYKWTKGTSTTSIGTGSTLSVSDLDAVYNCTVTW